MARMRKAPRDTKRGHQTAKAAGAKTKGYSATSRTKVYKPLKKRKGAR